MAIDPPPAPEPPLGAVVGPYTLLRKLGEGGMGVVYLAEQARPVRRQVALKVIRPGQDSSRVIARFEAERQALAMMDHPHIARVLDAGTTDAGLPYFAMELVAGVPITDYCDQHRLTPRQRLRLFAQVCQAVQHAHAKGVIHRDLKPGNVLVAKGDDGAPVPKVIDFGIAKAVGGRRLTDLTLCTRIAELVGTPLYMSPEQAGAGASPSAAADIDTRSDIYSLGVILYELLTGTTPFERRRLADAASDEVRRIIREEDPPKPSTRLGALGPAGSTVAASRHTDARRLGQTIRGELDWIVMRAIEKDRARRYATADALARDVERYLGNEPVEAGPPSRAYRLRKFARRNKAALTTTAVVAIALIAAASISSWQAVRANRAGVEARREADKQQAVNQFLNDMLAAGNDELRTAGDSAKGPDISMREIVDRAARTVDAGSLKDQPAVEAAVRKSLGTVYLNFRRFDLAEQQFRTALRLYQKVYGPEHAEVADCMVQAAYAMGEAQNGSPAAEALARQGLAMHRRLLGDQNPMTLGSMRVLCFVLEFSDDQRKISEAEQLCRQTITIAGRLPANQSRSLVPALHDLARLLRRRKSLAEAEEAYRKAIDVQTRTGGADHPALASLWQEMGDLLVQRDKPRDAEAAYRESLRIDPYKLEVTMVLERLLQSQKRDDDANRLVDGFFARLKSNPLYPIDGWALLVQGISLRRRGDLSSAEFLLRLAQSNIRRSDPTSWHLVRACEELEQLLDTEGRSAEAAALRVESLTAYSATIAAERRSAKDPRLLASLLGGYGGILIKTGRAPEAERPLRESLALSRKCLDPDNPEMYWLLTQRCACLERLGKAPDVPAVWREQVEALRQRLAVTRAPAKRAAIHLALLTPLVRSGQIAAAKAEYQKAVDLGLPPALSPDDGESLNDLARSLADAPDAASRDPALAIELARKAAKAKGGEDATVWSTLGVAYYRAGDYESADKTLLQSFRLASDGLFHFDRAIRNAFDDPEAQRKITRGADMFFLALCEWQLGHAEQARRWYDEAVVWSDAIRPPGQGVTRAQREAEALFRTNRPTTLPATAPATVSSPPQ